jgi:glycosyltransferase involved in cell wall biosynthesis
MALYESQAVGTPVVTTRAGGTQEAMIDGITGIVVPPSSPAEIASAILSILESPEKRLEMAFAAKSFAKTRTIEASADALLETFASVAPAG